MPPPPPKKAETGSMSPDELEKVRAEIGKLMAETAKIDAEARWYPFVTAAGLFAAALGLLKLLT